MIGRPPNNLLLDRLQVDAGSSAGVRVGDPVVADGGLVGHVSFVASDSSFVTLITDPSSSVSVKVLDAAGDTGLLKPSVGDPLDLLVQLLPRHAHIRAGRRRRQRRLPHDETRVALPAEHPDRRA